MTRVPGVPFVQAAGNYVDKDGLHFGFAWHATSNTASAENEGAFAHRREDGVSAHFYIDKDSAVQALDLERKAGHAGSAYGNEGSIAFELTGLDTWTRQQWIDNIAWPILGGIVAWIIRHDPDYVGFQNRHATVAEMRANPKVKAHYGHNDMRLAWGGTTHTDPGPNFPWDTLINAVGQALGDGPTEDDVNQEQDERLRRIEITLGCFIQGKIRTDLQPGLGDKTFTIVPNVLLTGLAKDVGLDAAELAAIEAVAKSGAAAAIAAAQDQLIDAFVAALPDEATGDGQGVQVLTRADAVAALRSVFADAGAEG